jgi:cAMP-dependent protein kinase regulator
MDPYERSKLSDAIKEMKFKKDEYIITEGDVGNVFYLIMKGTCIATKDLGDNEPTHMKDYNEGDYFGERALLTNENRAANIVVTSNECVLLSLERETFTRLLGSL